MRAQLLTNACILVETPDLRILTDPWFTPGVYEGSWFHSHPVEPFDEPVDAIWISHLHPDHYDPVFLKQYLARFPETRLLCAEHDPPYMQKMMARDGFQVETFEHLEVGATRLITRTSRYHAIDNIDSILTVESQGKKLVCWSDTPHDTHLIEDSRGADIAFLPFTGAGPFPQCYELPTWLMLDAASSKATQYTKLWEDLLENLEPRIAVPFAGEYLLGGFLSPLNHLRGMPDATEMPDATVLVEGTWIAPDGPEMQRFSPRRVDERIASLAGHRMDYELEEPPENLRPLLLQAIEQNPIFIHEPFWLGLHWGDSYTFSLQDDKPGTGEPRVDITVDPRHLKGILERRWHWNNAEIGSHLRFEQHPRELGVVPALSTYLSHLHI